MAYKIEKSIFILPNGMFIERHYIDESASCAASGAICCYVAPGERTRFHRIDCDEYRICNCGAPLDIRVVAQNGNVDIRTLGVP